MTDLHWSYLAAVVYWLLATCWLAIVIGYAREYRRLRQASPLFGALILVIWLDGARTLIESLYFGLSYTARTPLLPYRLHETLADPQWVLYPKLTALAAATAILVVMRRGWFPNLARELERQRELERVNRQLREAQAARDTLTRMLVHDMRTPLTNLLTGLRSARTLEDPETEREVLHMALRGGERLLRMVDELLDLQRLENGRMPIHLAAVPLTACFARVVEEVCELAEERQLHLVVSPPGKPVVQADPELLHRTLVNLVANAVRHSPRGGTVLLGAAPAEEWVRLFVSDEGPGVPPALRERIFEPFFQAEESGTALSRGHSGLGLAFCRLAAEAQGGRIGVEDAPGGGARFWLLLPAAPAASAEEAVPGSAANLPLCAARPADPPSASAGATGTHVPAAAGVRPDRG